MPKITYIEHNGKKHEIDVPKDLTVMEGAIQNNISIYALYYISSGSVNILQRPSASLAPG